MAKEGTTISGSLRQSRRHHSRVGGLPRRVTGICSDATDGTILINNVPGLTKSTNSTGWAVFTNISFPDPGQKSLFVSGVSFDERTDFTRRLLTRR